MLTQFGFKFRPTIFLKQRLRLATTIKDMPSWTKDEVNDWLLNNKIPLDVRNIFLANEIDGVSLAIMKQEQIEYLKINSVVGQKILELRRKRLKKSIRILEDAPTLRIDSTTIASQGALSDYLRQQRCAYLRPVDDPGVQISDFDELVDGKIYALQTPRDTDVLTRGISRLENWQSNLSKAFEQKANEGVAEVLSTAHRTDFRVVGQGLKVFKDGREIGEIDGCLESNDAIIVIETKLKAQANDLEQLEILLKSLRSADTKPVVDGWDIGNKTIVGAIATMCYNQELTEAAKSKGYMVFVLHGSGFRETTGGMGSR